MAERFFRTLKEQVIYGRAFHTIAEVRQTVGDFVKQYNQSWRIEKNGFLSPEQKRVAMALKAAA